MLALLASQEGGTESFALPHPSRLAGSRWVLLVLLPMVTPLACLPVVVTPRLPREAAVTAPPLAAARLLAGLEGVSYILNIM